MIKQKIVVRSKKGIHARPASQIVQVASKFSSHVCIQYEDSEINAKSIIGILTMGIVHNETVTLTAEGEDEKQAMETLTELFRTVLT